MQRPDLTSIPESIVKYIEYLESMIEVDRRSEAAAHDIGDFIEPETTECLLTMSQMGYSKRTYRHHYMRQHRGGMGIFDIDVGANDAPALLAAFDESQNLLLLTNQARVFRFALRNLDASPVRSKGMRVFERLGFEDSERIVAICSEQAAGYLVFVSVNGYIRVLRHHLFGDHMKQGTLAYNEKEFGPLAAACWTTGDADLFILSRGGIAIRFNGKTIPPQGTVGLRLSENDQVVSVASVDDNSIVFLLGRDGKGAARMMNGFAANKSPGGSGKIALKSDWVVSCAPLTQREDIFIISKTSKIIRFRSDEIPVTEGVVQGVNCMSLRQDEVVGLCVSKLVG